MRAILGILAIAAVALCATAFVATRSGDAHYCHTQTHHHLPAAAATLVNVDPANIPTIIGFHDEDLTVTALARQTRSAIWRSNEETRTAIVPTIHWHADLESTRLATRIYPLLAPAPTEHPATAIAATEGALTAISDIATQTAQSIGTRIADAVRLTLTALVPTATYTATPTYTPTIIPTACHGSNIDLQVTVCAEPGDVETATARARQ